MQRFTRILIVAIVCVLSLNMTAIAASGFVQPATETEKVRPATLTYSPNLTKAEVEQFLGRKMTRMERLGFKINKKKFVNTTNMAMAMADGDTTNTWAIVGFVSSLIIPVLGIVFSAIALGQIKKTGQKGKGLATAGLVIGIVFTALAIISIL